MSRVLIQATWDDAPHLTADQKAKLYDSIPAYQRDARTKGIPQLGSGAIYPIQESDVVVEPFRIPDWYRHCYGLDVGWNRTAAIWGALDPEADVLYLYSEHYRGQAEPPIHAQAINGRGKWIPGVVDPAARGRSQADGQQLLAQYVALDLDLTIADNGVESGIYEMWTRMSSGRLKVFSTMQAWRGEFRIYRRDENGKIVKENDHAMDASRYLCVSGVKRAIARPPEAWITPLPGGKNRSRHQSEYDPFGKQWGT